jgi:hypothetical protein
MQTPQEILNATYISLVAEVVRIGAAALAISVVGGVDARQTASHSRLMPGSKVTRSDA